MDTTEGFEPITALFYSVFHPHEGTKVIHQVPSKEFANMFDFDIIKNYVIPKPQLCNKLITFKIGNYRVLGYPVNIYGSHYARNSFSFNFCFVFNYDSDTTPYEGNIKRIGKMFRALEEQSQLLSKSLEDSEVYFNQSSHSPTNQQQQQQYLLEDDLGGKYLKEVKDWDQDQIVLDTEAPGRDYIVQTKLSSIESLIEQIYQDLNNYSECMIPIDVSNSVDLKLFPISPPPPTIHSYDVPMALMNLESIIDPMWDPTMIKIVPFINGINSIGLISEVSNSDYQLTKKCIQHFLHYKAITILDIFQFNNRYCVTCDIGKLLTDIQLGENCQEFVLSSRGTFDNMNKFTKSRNSENISRPPILQFNSHSSSNIISPTPSSMKRPTLNNNPSSTSGQNNNTANGNGNTVLTLPSIAQLFELYASLNQFITLKNWVLNNAKLLQNIDVRKFIIFGTLNGLIYRVRSYPLINKLKSDSQNSPKVTTGLDQIDEDQYMIQHDDKKKLIIERKLKSLIKKGANLDEMCTNLKCNRLQLEELLPKISDDNEWDLIHA